jgi:hypothetical protein
MKFVKRATFGSRVNLSSDEARAGVLETASAAMISVAQTTELAQTIAARDCGCSSRRATRLRSPAAKSRNESAAPAIRKKATISFVRCEPLA